MNKLTAVKNHVVRNRAKYAVAATLTVCVALQINNAKTWNAFLDKHGLTNEYYETEEI